MLEKSGQVEKIIQVDGFFVEKRRISFWKFWLFMIWVEEEKLNFSEDAKEKLISICKKEKCLFVQIETINYGWINKKFDDSLFKIWYYKKFITPFTAIIDLKKEKDVILKEMKPKGRYNIKLAREKWILVKEVENTKENIKIFYDLMFETTSRNWFSWNKLEYYEIFLKNIKSSSLLLAYYNEKVIAWWIFIFEKDFSIYYYWASTSDEKYRNLMAPFLVQWTAIEIAKEKWSLIYDFLWIATPWDKNSSLNWVTDFKMKLTKDIVNVSDSYIWINCKIIFFIIKLIRKLK